MPAHHIQHIQPTIQGISYMSAFISSAVALVAGFGIGWYVKGRGLTGVKTDASNAKNAVVTEVKAIENTVAPTPAA